MKSNECKAPLNRKQKKKLIHIISYKKKGEQWLRARMLKMLNGLHKDDVKGLEKVANNLNIPLNELEEKISLYNKQGFHRFINYDGNEV